MTRRKALPKLSIIGIALTIAAALAACSSSSSSSSSNSSTGTTGSSTGTSSAKSAIKIFVTSSFTGTTYSDPEALAAAKASADTINASGGVNGHPISIISCDDQETPAGATKCAEQAVTDKVTAVTGVFLFGTQTFSILQPSSIPVMDADAIDPIDLSASNSFPINAGSDPVFYAAALKVVQSGAKRVAILAGNSASDALGAQAFVQAVKNAGGTVAKTVTVTLGAPDYSPYVQSALSAGNVQGLLYDGTVSDLQKLVQATQQANFNGPIGMNLAGSTTAIVKQLGAQANNLYMASTYFVPPSSEASPFTASMAKYAPQAALDPVSEGVWAAVQTVAKALAGTSNYSAQGLFSALESQTALSIGPYAPTLNFTKSEGTSQEPRLATNEVVFYRVKNGVYTASTSFYNPYGN
jgi:ABC-type branched-subunit amino acid transport system substrate-binding protein